MNSLQKYLMKWNKTTDSLTKIQYTYALLTIALFLVAAVVSLINSRLGQSILFLSFVSLLAFVANGIIWSIVNTFVTPRIESVKKPRK